MGGCHILTDHADALIKGTESLASELRPALANVLAECQEGRFAVLGIDTLLKQDGSLALIRVNSFPNFVMTRDINEQVHVPLFESVLQTMVGKQPELLSVID